MATNFPSSLDNFTNPVSGNTLDSPSHSLQHSDANDAIEAIEAKLGVGASPAGSAVAGQVLTASTGGTTTWSTPTVPGLVQVIPTSVAVGSGSGSVDSLGNITFSGASSISINGCFTSTYDNYRIIFKATAATGVTDVNFRLRASGTDNSSGIYEATGVQSINTGTTLSAMNQSSGATSIKVTYVDNVLPTFTHFVMDICSPQMNIVTTANWQSNSVFGATMYGRQGTMGHNSTTQFDGFSLIGVSGNLSGTMRVYGYRD